MLGLNLSLGLASNSQVRNAVSRMASALRRIGGSLWMVDNAFSGAFVDNAGTTPVTAYGDLLGRVLDKTGGNHATQSAVASKPSVQRIGSATVISFDGSNDFLQTGITTGNEGFVAAGVTPSDVTASRSVACSGAGSTTAKGVYLYAESGNWIFQVGNGSARQEPGRIAAAINQPAVVSAGWNASTISLDVNTTRLSSARSGDCVGPAPMTLGSYITGTLPFSGSMHAFAYTPVLPDAATRKIIRDGIAALQGRTL